MSLDRRVVHAHLLYLRYHKQGWGFALRKTGQTRNIDTLFVALLGLLFLNLLQVQVREESCEGLGEAVGILL